MTLEASTASLLRTALFADLSASEARTLAGLLRPFAAAAGEVLSVQGAPADRLFLVDEGRLDAFVSEPDGSSELLSSVGPGDHLGEMALNHAMLRLATIRAREATRGRVLLAEDFAALRRACEPLALKVLLRLARLLCARLRLRTAAITGTTTETIGDVSPEVFDGPQPAEPVQLRDLRVLEFFRELGDAELATLLAAMRRWQIPRGRRVTTAGTPGSSACVIVSGAVELSVQRGQRRQQLAVVGPGKMFGMVSMIDGGPRRTTGTVREDAVLLELRAEAFERILAAGGRLAFSLVERVNRDLIASQRQSNREVVRLTQTSGPGRDLSAALQRRNGNGADGRVARWITRAGRRLPGQPTVRPARRNRPGRWWTLHRWRACAASSPSDDRRRRRGRASPPRPRPPGTCRRPAPGPWATA